MEIIDRDEPIALHADSSILVVDDEPYNIDLLAQELTDLGYRIITASNGSEALNVLAHSDCDLALIDIMMPEMDGFQVLSVLRETNRLASLPVIVISAIDDVASIARCLELGAEDFITKPFDPTILHGRVNGVLEKKRLRDQVQQQLELTKAIFGRYVPGGIARQILAGKGTVAPAECEASVLFLDIEGFTGIAERMVPSEVMAMLSAFFSAVLEPITRFGGVVNQISGDAMLVTFNVPVRQPHHADNAIRSAIEIQRAISERQFGNHFLKLRIGINTGLVVAGNIQVGERLSYTVIGDTVNVAARLEKLNKEYGSNILISGTTARSLHAEYPMIALGEHPLRGKKEPVEVLSVTTTVQ